METHLLEWLWVVAVILGVGFAVARSIRARHHVPKHAPRYRAPTPSVPDNPAEPRAADRVRAFVTHAPAGRVSRLLGSVAVASVLPSQPTSAGPGAVLAPKSIVEVRELATSRVLATYDWSRNTRGAIDHAQTLNDRATTMSLSNFLADLGLPTLGVPASNQ